MGPHVSRGPIFLCKKIRQGDDVEHLALPGFVRTGSLCGTGPLYEPCVLERLDFRFQSQRFRIIVENGSAQSDRSARHPISREVPRSRYPGYGEVPGARCMCFHLPELLAGRSADQTFDLSLSAPCEKEVHVIRTNFLTVPAYADYSPNASFLVHYTHAQDRHRSLRPSGRGKGHAG